MSSDLDIQKKNQKRSFILGSAKFLIGSVVFGKLYYLQIIQQSKYGKLSDQNRTKLKVLYPERGSIFDLNGEIIATNRLDYQLTLFTEKKELAMPYLKKLEKIIEFSDLDYVELKKNLKSQNRSDFIILKKNLSWKELEVFELLSHKFPFLFISKEKVRDYSKDLVFSHVIGYVGYKPEVSNRKLFNLKVGISGIEKLYDEKLVGSHGWTKIETNSSGRIMKTLKQELSKAGRNIQTNLISEIQELAYDSLKGKSGSIVVIDCENGGVNCMVSTPSFDNNEFSNGVSKKKWNELINDDDKPLLNKSIAGLYAPGSTLKLLTALHLLHHETGLKISDKYNCKGFVELGAHKFHCWKRGGHGPLNLFEAIKQSCDCYFYNIAKKINLNSMSKLCKIFSIGEKTNIDIPNELKGVMPDEKWKMDKIGEKWHLGETLNTVIGQGFTLCTPLQITLMTARLATGKMIKPSILRNTIRDFQRINIPDNQLEFIRESMKAVVNDFNGTAYASRLKKGLVMAGKTGTSQVRRITLTERESGVLENTELPYKLRDHSIFTAFAPFKKPKFAITVLIEHAGSGSKFAAPVAQKIIKLALQKHS